MQNRPKILYLSNSYPATVSGVTTVVNNLLGWMSPYYTVGVICPNDKPRYATRVINGIQHYFLPSYPTLIRKDVRFITPNPIQLQKAFDDFRPDLIHFHDPSPASIILKDICLRSGIPVIFSHHFTPQMVLGYLPESLKSIAQNNDGLNRSILQLTCRMYENASQIVVPTLTVKKSLLPFTDIPVRAISSGVDLNAFQDTDTRKLRLIAAKYHLPLVPYALYVGRLDPDKNLHILLESWAIHHHRYPDSQLVIAGEGGSLPKLQSLAANLEISSSIIWTGMIPATDLPYIFKNRFARVFTISSPIETQSIVTLMALAAGLPVVAAHSGALPEIVHNQESGYLCESTKPRQFAKHISFLLSHPAQAKEMGLRGSKIAKKHDFPLIIKSYRKLYESTLFLNHHPHA